MGKQRGVVTDHSSQPFPCPRGTRSQSLIFVATPADQVGVYLPHVSQQERLVEVAVVVDPALELRVEHPRQIIEGLVAPSVK
jgi:hypothetical protein